MKKRGLLILLSMFLITSCSTLPKPKVGSGIRGEQFEIDANINEATIDNYLFRDDCVYIDCRMLDDPAIYENIGGDSKLSSIIDGFEVVPFPYVAPVSDLPSEVGKGYDGETLFSLKDGHYIANYQESMSIIESIFPYDKAIILMCGGGGYAYSMKSFLIDIGYTKNKIYNAGGVWFYSGEHLIDLKVNDTIDYSRITYHEINKFNTYTKL